MGYEGYVAIRGGSSFNLRVAGAKLFGALLKDIGFYECKYSSVTLVWAGNDPTSRHTAPDTLTQAIEDVMAFGIRYGVPIRLVDVVGER